jgi:RNA polymerase sigma factor (sigma-70 family)
MFNLKYIAAPPCVVPLSSSFRVVDLSELKSVDNDISTAVSFSFDSNDSRNSKDPKSAVVQLAAAPKPREINDLYLLWRDAVEGEKDLRMEALLEGVHKFVNHLIWQRFTNMVKNESDVTSDVMLKVSQKIDSFRGESLFSTWVYQIIRRQALSLNRTSKRRNEVEFNEWRAIEAAAPSSVDIDDRKKYKNRLGKEVIGDWTDFYNDWLVQHNETDSRENQDKAQLDWQALREVTPGAEGQPCTDTEYYHSGERDEDLGKFIGKQAKDATENEWITDLDIQSSINRLAADDRRLVELVRQGYDGNEIGKLLGRPAKQVYNRYNRIIKGLECEVVAYSVLLHTCNPNFVITKDFPTVGRFISDGKKPASFRALPERCRCRREITRSEAYKLEESGVVQLVFKLKNGKLVTDEKQVWSERAVRVPRVSATNVSTEKYAAGDKTSRRNLDLAHQLSVLMLRELMHGPAEIVRHPVSGEMVEVPTARPVDESKDVWRGQAFFVAWTDRRTEGGFTRETFKPNPTPNKPTKYTLISRDTCPKCHVPDLQVSVDPESGSIQHECHGVIAGRFPCTYLQVWHKK